MTDTDTREVKPSHQWLVRAEENLQLKVEKIQ